MPMCSNCYGETSNPTRCVECNATLHRDCAVKTDEGLYCDTCNASRVVAVEKKPLDIEIPTVIRRSHIEQYRSCGYSLYLSLKEGVLQHNNESDEEDGDESIYAKLGRDLHELFDQGCISRTLLKGQMKEAFSHLWYNYDPSLFESEEFKDKMWKRAMDSIETFYTVLESLPVTPFAGEQNIIFNIGDGVPDVSITMDRIDEIGGELYITDWKTGKVMTGKKFTTDLQAPLYIYAIKQFYGKPVKSFTLHYLSENKSRTFERVNDDEYVVRVINKEYRISLTEAVREVKSLFSQLVKGNFNIPDDVKKLYFTCKMCKHKKNGKCRGAEEEIWHQINRNREM